MEDDLTVVRRGYAVAQRTLALLRREVGRSYQHIEQIEAELTRQGRERSDKLMQALCCLRLRLRDRGSGSIRKMIRPPSPPPSPEDLGAVAVVCRCLVELRSAAEVRQHWDLGCFDELEPNEEFFADMDEEEREFFEQREEDAWIKGPS